jgi:hypothetical protein
MISNFFAGLWILKTRIKSGVLEQRHSPMQQPQRQTGAQTIISPVAGRPADMGSSPQSNPIVLPPPVVTTETTEERKQQVSIEVEPSSDPCCSFSISAGWLVLGLIMFLVFVTIAGQLGQASDAFCQGYVSF